MMAILLSGRKVIVIGQTYDLIPVLNIARYWEKLKERNDRNIVILKCSSTLTSSHSWWSFLRYTYPANSLFEVLFHEQLISFQRQPSYCMWAYKIQRVTDGVHDVTRVWLGARYDLLIREQTVTGSYHRDINIIFLMTPKFKNWKGVQLLSQVYETQITMPIDAKYSEH